MKLKNLLLTAVATLGLTAATMAQNVPSYVPTNGLIGWWPFNGNANDESINTNDGTVIGATLTTDRFGITNRAFSFDGIGDSIVVLNIPFCSNYSFNSWIKCDTLLTPYPLIYNQLTSFENNRLHLLGVGYPNNLFGKGFTGDDSNGNLITSTIRLDDANWNMISVVYDYQNGIVKMYINGTFNGSAGIAAGPSTFGGRTKFGNGFTQQPNSPPYDSKGFVGKIDDIGIWNRALTQQEITDLYNGNICYETITVTDTLLINMGITGFNPVNYSNTIKIFPNPTNDHITIDYGNFASLNGYQLKIINSLSQNVFQTNITQQSDYLNLTTWGGNGLYFVQIIDTQGNIIDIRKIVIQ